MAKYKHKPKKKGMHPSDKVALKGAVMLTIIIVGAVAIMQGDAQHKGLAPAQATPVDTPRPMHREAPKPVVLQQPAPLTAHLPAKRDKVREFAFYAAEQAGIDGHIFWGLLLSESGANPNAGCSKADACGIGQMKEAAAQEMGVDRFDWRQNILGSAFYLAKKRREFDGDINMAITAYNAGAGRIKRWVKAGAHFERLPDEAQKYLSKVQLNASKSRRMDEVQVAWEGK